MHRRPLTDAEREPMNPPSLNKGSITLQTHAARIRFTLSPVLPLAPPRGSAWEGRHRLGYTLLQAWVRDTRTPERDDERGATKRPDEEGARAASARHFPTFSRLSSLSICCHSARGCSRSSSSMSGAENRCPLARRKRRERRGALARRKDWLRARAVLSNRLPGIWNWLSRPSDTFARR